jgi:hypothetical protein
MIMLDRGHRIAINHLRSMLILPDLDDKALGS